MITIKRMPGFTMRPQAHKSCRPQGLGKSRFCSSIVDLLPHDFPTFYRGGITVSTITLILSDFLASNLRFIYSRTLPNSSSSAVSLPAAFDAHPMAMALYFTLLGGIFGFLHGFDRYRTAKLFGQPGGRITVSSAAPRANQLPMNMQRVCYCSRLTSTCITPKNSGRNRISCP